MCCLLFGFKPPLIALIAAALILTLAHVVNAGINPWIAADSYDPKKWDSAGPQTATPWLHPPTWKPEQKWGVLSGRIGDATTITGSWGGTRDRLVENGVSFVGGYLGQPAAKPVGGEQEDESSWLSNVSFGAFFDLKRLMDWKARHGLNLGHSISHRVNRVRREKSKNSVISVSSARGRVNV